MQGFGFRHQKFSLKSKYRFDEKCWKKEVFTSVIWNYVLIITLGSKSSQKGNFRNHCGVKVWIWNQVSEMTLESKCYNGSNFWREAAVMYSNWFQSQLGFVAKFWEFYILKELSKVKFLRIVLKLQIWNQISKMTLESKCNVGSNVLKSKWECKVKCWN